MVQRSSTHILRSDTMTEEVLGDLYSERALANGVTTRMADLTFASIPYKVMPEFHIPLYERIQRKDAAFYDALRKAGFMLDFGADGSGLFLKYLRRGSGYYIDVGASDLVIDGSIKLKSGVEIDCITQTGVRFADGSELPADLIVYATGYGSMNGWAADLISQDVADKVGKVWGLGSDTPKDPGPGRARNATCGSPPSSRTCGSMAATCTSRATIRSISRFSSRRGWRDPHPGLRPATSPSPELTQVLARGRLRRAPRLFPENNKAPRQKGEVHESPAFPCRARSEDRERESAPEPRPRPGPCSQPLCRHLRDGSSRIRIRPDLHSQQRAASFHQIPRPPDPGP
jgi:hypothetical protein